jgi:invasion protein IalB
MLASRLAAPAGTRRRRSIVTSAVLASTSLICAAAQTAPAQAPETPPAAAWRVECTGDGKTLDCRAVQQVFHRETRQLLVSVAMRPAADGKTGAMLVTLPLGLNLTEPVTVKVDNGASERQAIQTCTNVGCFVALTATDKLIAAMRTGNELKIIVQDANKKPIEMGLPLLGFALAFDKAK